MGLEVYRRLARDGHTVETVCVPHLADRLATVEAHVRLWSQLQPDVPLRPMDLIVCAQAEVFVPSAIRHQARWGAIGYHPSLLPRHRGKDAVRATIAAGDPLAGGTVYWLNDGWDEGDIMLQGAVPVTARDAATLWRQQLAPLGIELLADAVRLVNAGILLRRSQR